MKTKIITTLCILFVGISMGNARHTPRINKRQAIQKVRTIEGIRNGELTRAETRQLVMQQKKVDRLKRRARYDGRITRRERKQLHRAQLRSSRMIAFKKHNAERRSQTK